MFDVKRYLEKKEKGLVSLSKLGSAFVASWQVFDPETGEEKTPIVEALDLEALGKLEIEAQSLKDGITQLITDLEALE